MKYFRVISLSLLALTLLCITSFTIQSKRVIEISPYSVIKTVGKKQRLTDENDPTPNETKSLLSTLHLDELEILRPLKTPRSFFNYKLIPDVKQKVPAYLKEQEIKWSMIAAIKSSYKWRNQRQAIRESWGRIRYLNGVRMHVIFVVALTETREEERILRNESEKFGDILQVELDETYRGVGLKALSAMQWAGDTFPDNWIYFSGDDDILPSMDTLVRNIQAMIDEAEETGRFEDSLPIHCAFHQAHAPPVHRIGKWIVTTQQFPYDTYPPICLGGFYGMSIKLTKAMYNASRHYPYFRHDDVFITGFMRLVACDLPEKMFHFDRTDVFCALSKIQNSGFQHIHRYPELYKLHWLALEEEMRSKGAEIIRQPDNEDKLAKDLQRRAELEDQYKQT